MPLSTFLNGGTATQLRGLMWLSLSDVGKVGAGTITDDAGGGGTATWDFGANVPCRLDPIGDRGEGKVVGARMDERTTHIVTVPAGTAVTANNRFSITGRGTFEVLNVPARTGEWARFFEVVEAS